MRRAPEALVAAAIITVGVITPISPAKITRYEPREVVVDVEGPASGTLVLTDTWYPGWGATVDGVATEILPANHIVRGVPVAAGHHQVVFRYQPRSLLLGGMISAVALLAMIGIAIRNPRLTPHPRTTPYGPTS